MTDSALPKPWSASRKKGRVVDTRDAARLLGEFGNRDDDEIGRAEDDERCDRARHEDELKAELFRCARRHRIVDRRRIQAGVPGEMRAKGAAARVGVQVSAHVRGSFRRRVRLDVEALHVCSVKSSSE